MDNRTIQEGAQSKKRLFALASMAIIIASLFIYEDILAKHGHNAQAINSETTENTTPIDPILSDQANSQQPDEPAETKPAPQEKPKSEIIPAPITKQVEKKHTAKKHHSHHDSTSNTSISNNPTSPDPAPQDNTTQNNELTFKLIIDTGKDKHTFTEKIEEGLDAFEALKKASAKEGFSLTYETSSWGAFVDSIYDIKPNGAYYWMFKINGKMSDVGASSYTIKADDTIKWDYMDTSNLF